MRNSSNSSLKTADCWIFFPEIFNNILSTQSVKGSVAILDPRHWQELVSSYVLGHHFSRVGASPYQPGNSNAKKTRQGFFEASSQTFPSVLFLRRDGISLIEKLGGYNFVFFYFLRFAAKKSASTLKLQHLRQNFWTALDIEVF